MARIQSESPISHFATYAFTTALAFGNAFAAAPLDLDALVTHESTVVTHTGVTRTERFSERIIRRAGHVWTERVVPAFALRAGHAAEKEAGNADHRHFDFEAAARHLTSQADGKTRLEYVDRDKKWTVFVPASEYGSVGFSGNWDTEFHLAPPALVERMPVRASRVAQTGGAVWHEERRNGWTNRVLWSPALQYPLAIEALRDDGTIVRKTVVKMLPATPVTELPWLGLAQYRQRTYDDFTD